jgi:YidC/Oxa1 family membrane protein insertase
VSLLQRRPTWLGPLLLLGFVALVVAGCLGDAGPTLAPGATATPSPRPTPIAPLVPAELKPDPVGVLAWLFTPIFQALFLLLVGINQVVPDIGIAIIIMTLVVRTLLVPLMRRQMVSTRRMQGIQPEMKELQKRYKGDPRKLQEATMALYRERGISQSGCLIMLLPLLIMIPMYTVIQQGLENPNPIGMLRVFGFQVFDVDCNTVLLPNGNPGPCLDTTISWLFGLAAHIPHIDFKLPVIDFGISYLAIFYTVLSLIASRISLPPHDPSTPLDSAARTQRNSMLIIPLISILYSNIIPVGLFLYLIVSTVYQILQQYLTTGWGSMFPFFGWMPSFAVDHKPRFPVAMPTGGGTASRVPNTLAPPTNARPIDRTASAAATIRPKGRTSRRGRRR